MNDPIVLIAAIIGALAGAVSFLFRQLVMTKNRRIDDLTDERDYWRQIVLAFSQLPDGTTMPDFEQWFQSHHPMPRPGREPRLMPKQDD